MADPKGFLKHGREVADAAPGRRAGPGLERGLPRTASAGRCCRSSPSRPAAAWTAASRSATRAARSATSSRSGTTWSGATTGTGAIERLHATNNFPEFTGRLCPAPCETACVLGINQDPVTIKNVEVAIIDQAWESGCVRPQPPEWLSGKTVAVIGSGPAGLAAAQQLTRAGHTVAVYERADKIGGLLRYGIPEFKMEKQHLDRRLDQMRREGTVFRAGVDVGADLTGRRAARPVRRRRARHRRHRAPATCRSRAASSAASTRRWSTCRSPTGSRSARRSTDQIAADGKHVVIIGGGDTGADCLGTAHRQGAASITQLEILPQPPRRPARPASRGRRTR